MLSRLDFLYKQIICVFTSRGDSFSFRNDNIIVKDSEGNIKHQSTCYRLFVLFIVGHITISSGLIQKSKRFQFSIILVGHNFKQYASWNTQSEGNVLLREKQYSYNSTSIAQHIVTNKLLVQKQALNQIRNKSNKLKQTIQQIKRQVQQLRAEVLGFENLLGIEGQAAKSYFKSLFEEDDWQGRKPRTKIDPNNTLMDIGYTLLFNVIESLLSLYGFDVYKGVYHQCFYQRKSLVCDLMEPMRPIIDRRIRNSRHLGQVKIEDFIQRQGQYILFGKKAVPYTTFLLEEIMRYKEELFLYIQQYYRAFIREKAIEQFPVFNL